MKDFRKMRQPQFVRIISFLLVALLFSLSFAANWTGSANFTAAVFFRLSYIFIFLFSLRFFQGKKHYPALLSASGKRAPPLVLFLFSC
jgi:hypothetical protein